MSIKEMFNSLENGVSLREPFEINWCAKEIGFGQFRFYEQDGKIYCSNELMCKEFIKKILCTMVDQCELTDPR